MTSSPEWLPERERVYLIFGFPGQSQQHPNMFDGWPGYSHETDVLLRYFHKLTSTKIGQPLDSDSLEHGSLMQPANVTLAVMGHVALGNIGVRPNEVFGHSLGEIPAACSAGFIDPEKAIWLAAKRGESTEYAVQQLLNSKKQTGMLVVMQKGIDVASTVIEQLRSVADSKGTEVSNFNSPEQVVVSGDTTVLTKLSDKIRVSRSAIAKILKVDGAFHSDYMQPAAEMFEPFVDKTPIAQPTHPALYSPTTLGRLVTRDQVARMFVDQLTRPVLYHQLIDLRLKDLNRPAGQRKLAKNNIEEVLFVEIGAYPSEKRSDEGVLIGLNKKNVRHYHTGNMPICYHRISSPEDLTRVKS